MPKLTLEDKRRETLRRQLYGKEETFKVQSSQLAASSSKAKDSQKTFSYSVAPTNSYQLTTANYLYKDLTKVILFSVLAIALQLSLYFLMQNHLVRLPF
jgi:hypothetical protein